MEEDKKDWHQEAVVFVAPSVGQEINNATDAPPVKTNNVNMCRLIAFSIEKQLPVKQFSVLLGSIDLTGKVRERGWMVDFFFPVTF